MCNWAIWKSRMLKCKDASGIRMHFITYYESRKTEDYLSGILIPYDESATWDSVYQLIICNNHEGEYIEINFHSSVHRLLAQPAVLMTNRYTKKDFIKNVYNRWKRWAHKQRAANLIRQFYFDFVLPRAYNPRTQGLSFLKMKHQLTRWNSLQKNSQD